VLSILARNLVPAFGRLTVTTDPAAALEPGSIIAPNHTSLVDPAVVLAALERLGVRPVVLATAGLWKVPGLGRLLDSGGHVAVHRATDRAASALDSAAAALSEGRIVLIYGEGCLPRRRDSAEAAPGDFRSGISRLALATGAPVVPLGQAGSRRISSGSGTKQIAGVVTAPLRRPGLHVHIGAPVALTGDVRAATEHTRRAVASAWHSAERRLRQHTALVV